jgi:hypothetical protein
MLELKPRSRKRKSKWDTMTQEEKKQWREDLERRMTVYDAAFEEKMKYYDPVVVDRNEIEKQLQSGASVFVLEVPKSNRSHCKARFCFPKEVRGNNTIDSRFHLNLKDLTRERTGGRDYWKRKIPSMFHQQNIH